MNTKELNATIQEIVDGLGDPAGLYPENVRPLLQKRLRNCDLRDVIDILFDPYFHNVHIRPKVPRVAKTIGDEYDEMETLMMPGTPKRASKEHILQRNPGLASHIKSLESSANDSFMRFGVKYTFRELTAVDLRHIADQYEALGNAQFAHAKTHRDLADDLEARGVETLGELLDVSPKTFAAKVKKLEMVS